VPVRLWDCAEIHIIRLPSHFLGASDRYDLDVILREIGKIVTPCVAIREGNRRRRADGSPPQRYYPPAVARIIEICQRTLVRPVGEFELAICAQGHLVTRFTTNQVTGSDFSSSGSS
jgi:hypothetical protein